MRKAAIPGVAFWVASALTVNAQNAGSPPPGEVDFVKATALVRGEFDGKPVKKDPEEALRLLEASAAVGYPNAPLALCVYHRTQHMGLMVFDAHEWCSVAAAIPGRGQAKAQALAKELDEVIGRTDQRKWERAQSQAAEAVQRFCALNRQHQPEPACADEAASAP